MTSTVKMGEGLYGAFFCLLLIMLLFSEPQEHSHLALFIDEVTKHLILQAGQLDFELLTTWKYREKLGGM